MSECETGWTRFGDNCYKALGTDLSPGMAQDLCMEEDSNIFFPQSLEEIHWIKTFLPGNQKTHIGFKGYKDGLIYNMDNSENVGIRGITRKQINLNISALKPKYFPQIVPMTATSLSSSIKYRTATGQDLPESTVFPFPME